MRPLITWIQWLMPDGLHPEDVAPVLCCPLCRGAVKCAVKPWHFRCAACAFNWKPADVGSLQRAIMRRVQAVSDADVG